MSFFRSAATVAAVAAAGVLGASVALASPASAEPIGGAYSGLLTDGSGQVLNPKPILLSFAPCGPDCSHLKTPRQDIDLHLQGSSWVGGYDWQGTPCTITVDGGASVLDDVCPNQQPVRLALTKNG